MHPLPVTFQYTDSGITTTRPFSALISNPRPTLMTLRRSGRCSNIRLRTGGSLLVIGCGRAHGSALGAVTGGAVVTAHAVAHPVSPHTSSMISYIFLLVSKLIRLLSGHGRRLSQCMSVSAAIPHIVQRRWHLWVCFPVLPDFGRGQPLSDLKTVRLVLYTVVWRKYVV